MRETKCGSVRPVAIDVPHYASLRDVTRQLVVWRSFDGLTWTHHDDVITSRDRPTIDDDADLVHTTSSDQLTAGPTSSYFNLLENSLVVFGGCSVDIPVFNLTRSNF